MKFFYFSFFVLMMCACGTTPNMSLGLDSANINLQQNINVGSNDNTTANLNVEGLYYGVSNDQLGQRAWLLRLEKGKGSLYMPPNNLKILKIDINSTGHINFQSEAGLGGKTYSFSGQINSKTIQGEFQLSFAPSTDAGITKFKALLHKIDISSLDKKNVYGLYSNVKYVEDGGDLVGEELILTPFNEELTGAFTSYENEMVPYAVNVRQLGNKLKFNINTENGEQNFQGLISSEKINLQRTDKNTDPETKSVILIKKKSLLNFLVN